MMFDGSCGFTATHGSSSLFTQLTSPGNRNPEMSHDENGLALDAWLTDVVAYGPAEATATGKIINRAATAASGMPLLIAFLLRSDPTQHPLDRDPKCQLRAIAPGSEVAANAA